MSGSYCDLCGRLRNGFGAIDNETFCHPLDGDGPDCYTLERRERARPLASTTVSLPARLWRRLLCRVGRHSTTVSAAWQINRQGRAAFSGHFCQWCGERLR